MSNLLDGVDPLALEVAKRAVLTDEFVKFRERAVQFAQVLTASNEYETLKKAMLDEAHLEKLALERLKSDPYLASVRDPDLKGRIRKMVWNLVYGLYIETSTSGLRGAIREAIRTADEKLLKQFDRDDAKVYKRLRAEFQPEDDGAEETE